MFGFLLNWDRVLGALIGFGLAWTILAGLNQFIWLPQAREDAAAEARAESVKRSMELLQERSRTNADVNALDAGRLCVELGGVFEDGTCN
ncbi:MAG: hypothetical protein QHC90_13125 [Shinella sp.]|nr:hypothetical protein [Shinella sp.]